MNLLPCFCLQLDFGFGASGALLAPALLYFTASVPCVLIFDESNTFLRFPMVFLQIDWCFDKRSAANDLPQFWHGTRFPSCVVISVGWLCGMGEFILKLNDGDCVRPLDIGCSLAGRCIEATEDVDFFSPDDDLLLINVLSFMSGSIFWLLGL